jgi:CHAD domain-containing protein
MASSTPKTTKYLEVERKFDVVDSTVAPSFEGLSAVARVERSPSQQLDAVYFDTPSHDLAAHRVTLRRRTGGTDAGWHLKLPAGPDARTEVRMPLGDDGDEVVPDDLLDVVAAIVRDRGVAPVARISTVRHIETLYGPDGAELAEFCDDQVSAWAAGGLAEGDDAEQQWREWELELIDSGDGAPDTTLLNRLSNRLHDAGAVPAGHGSKLARVLDDRASVPGHPQDGRAVPVEPVHRAVAEQVDELLVWDRAVRADTYDSVHQMRVITRKIRSLLQASEESFGLSDDAWILDELRQLASVLGDARDAEVLAERYERALDELPADLLRGRVRERLVDGAKRRYQAGLRRSLTAMRSQRYFRLLDALGGLVAAEPAAPPPGQEPTPVTIDSAYKRVRKAAKAATNARSESTDEERDEALHRIRKGAKRLRYTAAATTVQTLLGDHQDSVVSRTHLHQQAEAAHAHGEDTFTYGLLYQQENDLAKRSRSQLDDALRKLDQAVRRAQ